MEKIKKILVAVLELLMLIVLLESLGKMGMGVLMGEGFAQISKVIIAFGVTIMSLSGILIGSYLPTRRHRVLRETQVHILKYLSVLVLYQILGFFITQATGNFSLQTLSQISPILVNVLMMTFTLIALMMPFNYVKSLFGVLKSVEFRDPRNVMKQFFR